MNKKRIQIRSKPKYDSKKKKKYGGSLPKYGGITNDSGYLPYMEANNQMYNPPKMESITPQITTPNTNTGLADMSGSFSEIPEQSGGLGVGTYATIAQTAGALTESMGTEAYESQFGEQESLVADLASSTTPVGAVIGGALETVGNISKSGVDYNKYGYAENEGQGLAYNIGQGHFDPAGQAQVQAEEGEWGKAAISLDPIGAAVISALDFGTEQDEAKKAEHRAIEMKNQARLNEINQGGINYGSMYEYGGRLPTRQYGGIVDPNQLNKLTPRNINIDVPEIKIGERHYNVDPTGYGASSKAHWTPLSSTSAKYELESLGLTPQQINTGFTAEQFDPNLINPEQYRYKKDATGSPSIEKRQVDSRTRTITPNTRTQERLELYPYTSELPTKQYGGDINNIQPQKPIIRKYSGETHEGKNGGIEVDQNGNPTSITNKEGVALTENNEVSFNGYIFSDNIEYK